MKIDCIQLILFLHARDMRYWCTERTKNSARYLSYCRNHESVIGYCRARRLNISLQTSQTNERKNPIKRLSNVFPGIQCVGK